MRETRGHAQREKKMCYNRACQLPDTVLMQIIAWSGTRPFCKQWRGAFQAMTADPQQTATWMNARYGKEEGLVRAVAARKRSVTQILLDRGADVHHNREEPLLIAAHSGCVEMLRLLINAGADISARKYGALGLAIESGNVDSVRLLYDDQCIRSKEKALIVAAQCDYLEVFRYVLERPTTDVHRALLITAITGRLEFMQLTLDHGVEFSRPEARMALKVAMDKGHEHIANLLRSRGVVL